MKIVFKLLISITENQNIMMPEKNALNKKYCELLKLTWSYFEVAV